MSAMKIIFLDIDGVLCLDGRSIDQRCLINLGEVVRFTGAKFVLSSTWRLTFSCRQQINLALGQIDSCLVGITPHLPDRTRIQEIDRWLAETQFRINDFLIIDDEDLESQATAVHLELMAPHVIQTNAEFGLCQREAEQAIRFLNKDQTFILDKLLRELTQGP